MNNKNLYSKGSKTKTTSVALKRWVCCSIIATSIFSAAAVSAQSIEKVRWKSEEQVREILGEPQSKRGPVGTHASYTMWDYGDYTVAFANKKAFHLFRKNSLKKMELNETRR